MNGFFVTEALVQDAMPAALGLRALWLQAPEVAAAAGPGQFVMVAGGPGRTTRRPFSISGVNRERGLVRLLVRVAGPASRWLAELAPESVVGLHGPLGTGFTLPGPGEDGAVWLVGGGVGVAPLLFLAAELRRHKGKVWAALGGRSAAELWGVEDLELRGAEVAVATEDGSAGRPGLVTALVERQLAAGGGAPERVYACGPRGMLVAVAGRVGAAGLRCEVSVEERMACGVGACAGCTWPEGRLSQGLVLRRIGIASGTPGKGEGGGPLRVCRDGPCFGVVAG